MADIACLTNRAGGGGDVLPALTYLDHRLVTLPLDTASLGKVGGSDLVLVDATRDLLNAQSLCRTLREDEGDAAILVVIPEAGLAGLQPDWGASDFVLPDAGPAEVEARIRLLAKRRRAQARDSDAAVRVGELVVDPVSYQVRLKGRPLDLTYKEFELLRFLAGRPGRVCTRGQLLQEVWGYDFFGGTRTVDVHVRRLRAKLGPEYESMITTIRGVGYKLVPAEQARAERETRERSETAQGTGGAG